MLLLRLLELLFVVVLVVAFILEVAVPLVRGTRLFPSFRKNPVAEKLAERQIEANELEDTLEATDDLIDATVRNSRLQQELREAEAELAEARTPKQPQQPKEQQP